MGTRANRNNYAPRALPGTGRPCTRPRSSKDNCRNR